MSVRFGSEFFVGYARPPGGVARFVVKLALGLVAGACVLGFALGYSVQERGGGGFGGPVKAVGRVANLPYPAFQIFPTAKYPRGHVMLIAGGGKQGMGATVAKLAGKTVEVRGFLLKRGDIDVVVTDTPAHYRTVDDRPQAEALQPQKLGRYRIGGEICDGKCYAGVMRPGTGISHKACANLCIAGDQPAVLATFRPIMGARFVLLADRNGKIPPPAMYDHVAVPVELEGELLRYGDLLILHADWRSIRRQ